MASNEVMFGFSPDIPFTEAKAIAEAMRLKVEVNHVETLDPTRADEFVVGDSDETAADS